jgi:glycosyltransferase involved in cell wall biosynthesis
MDHDFWSEAFLKDHRIAVTYLRPSPGRVGAVPNIAWVPDFQHLHLPDMFSQDDIEFRTTQILLAAQYSSHVILSSYQASQDFSRLAPVHAHKGRVLQFVASVDPSVYRRDSGEAATRLGTPKQFFYLPNQFWRHKNHLVVVKALGLLKAMGHHPIVVCTGNLKDYRHPAYLQELNETIREQGVADRFLMLGMVPADDVFALIRQSIAVINPSLFEGWSTTVEEAKSIGKRALLSDIPVHIEQAPPGAIYFSRSSPEDLAQKMLELWEKTPPGPDLQMEAEARDRLNARLEACGRRFFEIAVEASCGATKGGV